MKKLLFFAVGLAVCSGLNATDDMTVKRFAVRANAVAEKWCARTQKSYGWNGSAWVLDETYRNTYNRDGLIISQTVADSDGSATRITNRYNSNGKLISRLTEGASHASGPFTKTQQLVREYDERVTSFITLNDQQVFINGDWRPSNTYSQTLTRNEDGNVTQMERAVLFNGIFDPTYHIFVVYDEDGKAVEITTEDLAYDGLKREYYWKPGNSYKDIVWHSFDGQIVSAENLYEGSNRIASANAIIGGEEYRISAEYFDDGSWISCASQFDPDVDMDLEERLEYTPLDEYGSCKIVNTMSYVEDDNSIGAECVISTYKYDSNGLILLEESVYDDGENLEIIEKLEGAVVYDTEQGYPLTWTLQEYDVESGDMVNSFKAEFSDYVRLSQSAINEIAADSECGYFNLLGTPVCNPQKGQILIEKSATGVRKIIF